jgi:hypothetical protein
MAGHFGKGQHNYRKVRPGYEKQIPMRLNMKPKIVTFLIAASVMASADSSAWPTPRQCSTKCARRRTKGFHRICFRRPNASLLLPTKTH